MILNDGTLTNIFRFLQPLAPQQLPPQVEYSISLCCRDGFSGGKKIHEFFIGPGAWVIGIATESLAPINRKDDDEKYIVDFYFVVSAHTFVSPGNYIPSSFIEKEESGENILLGTWPEHWASLVPNQERAIKIVKSLVEGALEGHGCIIAPGGWVVKKHLAVLSSIPEIPETHSISDFEAGDDGSR